MSKETSEVTISPLKKIHDELTKKRHFKVCGAITRDGSSLPLSLLFDCACGIQRRVKRN
jgi:hypothetical protein